MSASSRQRVLNGATWLDMNIPDWMDRIDLDRLNMALTGACILSQANETTWIAAISQFNLDADAQINLGFRSGGSVTYSELDAEWTNLVRTRQRHGYRQPEPTPEPEITLLREDLELMLERLNEMEDDANTLESVTFNINGVKVNLA